MKKLNNKNLNLEDLYLEDQSEGTLGFFTKVQTQTTLTVPIDQEFKEPSYYRHVVAAINELTEDDQVIFEINSEGGRADGLIALLSAIERTPAISIAVINGMAASAASILALNCNVCLLTDNAAMMCHNASFSTGGKSYDVASHVAFERKRSDDLMRRTYKHFLTEEEIEELLKGIEFWIDTEELDQRLSLRDELRELEAEQEELEEEDSVEYPDLHEEPNEEIQVVDTTEVEVKKVKKSSKTN